MKKTVKKAVKQKVVKKTVSKTLVRYAIFQTKKGKLDNSIWFLKKTNDPTIKEYIGYVTMFPMPCRAEEVPAGTQFKWELTIKNYDKPEVKAMEKAMKDKIDAIKADRE